MSDLSEKINLELSLLEETVEQLKWLKEKHEDGIEVVSPVTRIPDYYKRYVTRDNLKFS